MERPVGAVSLEGRAKLTTIDCIAQSLAVGPIFSAAALGSTLALLAGGVGPFVIVLTTIGILGLGYLVSELAKRFSGSGTVYEYVANTLGKRPAVFAAGCYHLAAISLVSGIPIIGSIFVKVFCSTHLDFDPPWWICAAVIGGLMIVVNVVGVQVSVRTQLVIIVASVVPFLILALAIVIDGGPGGNTLSVFDPGNVAEGGSVFKGLLFAILMFVGFELAAALGEETEDPKRSIPKALLATILIVAGFYIVTQYVGAIGSGGPDALPFDFGPLATHYVGSWLGVLIELAIILDILAVGIGFTAAAARGLFTLARDGLLPAPLAAVDAKRSPRTAILAVGGVLAVVNLVMLVRYGTGYISDETGAPVGPPEVINGFVILTTIGGFVICIVYALLCIGGLKLFGRLRDNRAVVAAVVGLVTAGGGVIAQFVEGTAPVGDALWGRHIGLAILVAVGAWLALNVARRPDRVELAGQHAVQHVEH